ncbi:Toxin-antitoxin biofilm protein TabA [Limihaloglobus sulfuriphilus]|uniref:Toxin-antitoxin biofilm protein TabA n=1 Tax=Limihaloglobus sulfuriphilus TaxID=1851148 RepID=A0A1Q2MCF3_9BACT|nr:YhcH/YjgK/YiaL family protein [Limihaloglobus sulfuriphilus]AQQ70386.1 Toxin-antitoxin biofilm protein TabA [Limihaloglobus sulfuriphilus]
MIIDDVQNSGFYKGISPLIDEALDLLAAEDFLSKPDGEYSVQGRELFYIVQRYPTKPVSEGFFETHKKYIDIQLVVSGSEMIGYANRKDLAVKDAYDESRDLEFYERPETFTPVNFSRGTFGIFWPQDGHMPGRSDKEKSDVCKVVFKVRYE